MSRFVWSLRIGPFRLAARSDDVSFAVEESDRSYEPFLHDPDGHPDFRLDVVAGPLPAVRLDRVVHKTRGQWWVAVDGGRLVCPFRIPAGAPVTRRVLRPDAAFRSGVLHVSPDEAARPLNPFGNLLSELLVTSLLARRDGLLLHAAAIVDRGRAYVFTGASGAGKSTIARIWREAGALALADESCLVTATGDGFEAHGTPWHGSEPVYAAASAPIAGVFFLEHARENSVRPLAAGEAAAGLLANAFAPWWSAEGAARAVETAARLRASVPTGILAFAPDARVIDFLREYHAPARPRP